MVSYRCCFLVAFPIVIVLSVVELILLVVFHHEGFAVSYDAYDKLCADDNVDIVYIGTLHTSHYEHTKLALQHDKHVLVEKPMAMNATQAEEVIALAKAKNKFLMEGR